MFETTLSYAQELDSRDLLKLFHKKFVATEPDIIYLDGNSLGRLPKKTKIILNDVINHQWGERLIRSWNEHWIELPKRLAEKIAKIVGAEPNEIFVGDSTSINLFKLIIAALNYDTDKHIVISDSFNFPSDLYVIQGALNLLKRQHKLVLLDSNDGLSISTEKLRDSINDETALVTLSHVAFKSAFMYNMHEINKIAHQHKALVLWDLSHAAGIIPIELNKSNADLAVGCTYKYLNGGPGSPSFLYVKKELQEKLFSPVWGWFGDKTPFNFNLNYEPAEGIQKFAVGTPPVLSLAAIEPGLDIIIEAGLDKIRQKSILQSNYMIFLFEQWLKPLGFELGSPQDERQRGSHISIRYKEGYRICQALINLPDEKKVIPDFRSPDNIRFGIAPLYNSFKEIHAAMEMIKKITEDKTYLNYSEGKSLVT